MQNRFPGAWLRVYLAVRMTAPAPSFARESSAGGLPPLQWVSVRRKPAVVYGSHRMNPDQLHQLAESVRQNLLSSIDSQIDSAATSLGLSMEDIDDDDWQSLIDMIFS